MSYGLLQKMIEETDLCRNEHSSYMKVLIFGQNVKTYPTTQCKFLLILKIGLPVFICASWLTCTKNHAKPFADMVYRCIRLSVALNDEIANSIEEI